MSGMRCTGEKCPIKELTDGATICTAHGCPHRTWPTTRADYIRSMSDEQMATELLRMFEELCEDGIPSPEYMMLWLQKPIEEDE